MNASVLQAGDVAGGSYLLALLGMVAEAALLLLATGWVARAWKLPVALAAIAGVVAAMSCFEGREVWLATRQASLTIQYVGWTLTMPLQVLTFFFVVGTVAAPPASLFWRLLVVSVLMVIVRYMGEAGFTHATLSFLIGIVGWLYILGELYFGRLNELVDRSADPVLQRGYFWMRLIVTIGWAVYPLCNFVGGFGGGVAGGNLAITYNLTDFINRIGFGLAVLATAMLKTDAPAAAPKHRF